MILMLVAGCGRSPFQAQAPAPTPRIGYLSMGAQDDQPVGWLPAFREGLREAGYLEGQNIRIEYRWADNRPERLQALAVDLADQNLDLIVTNGTPAVQATQRATKTTPIVMAFVGDPVGQGLVASLARPGGNATGLTSLGVGLAPKRLQLLKESFPGISRIGVLHNPDDPGRVLAVRETDGAAALLGLQVQSLELREVSALEATLAGAVGEGVDALIVLASGAVNSRQGRAVVDGVAQQRLPAMYDGEHFMDAGGLMFYGVNYARLFRRAATYVDKIVKGANPAELPIERPTTFDFVINLQTARALGLTVPPQVLAQATEVIQ
jgi:putative ABC transport system substrate-binding protein